MCVCVCVCARLCACFFLGRLKSHNAKLRESLGSASSDADGRLAQLQQEQKQHGAVQQQRRALLARVTELEEQLSTQAADAAAALAQAARAEQADEQLRKDRTDAKRRAAALADELRTTKAQLQALRGNLKAVEDARAADQDAAQGFKEAHDKAAEQLKAMARLVKAAEERAATNYTSKDLEELTHKWSLAEAELGALRAHVSSLRANRDSVNKLLQQVRRLTGTLCTVWFFFCVHVVVAFVVNVVVDVDDVDDDVGDDADAGHCR